MWSKPAWLSDFILYLHIFRSRDLDPDRAFVYDSNPLNRVPDKRIVKPVYPELSALDVVEYVFHISDGFCALANPLLLLGDLFADGCQFVRQPLELTVIFGIVIFFERPVEQIADLFIEVSFLLFELGKPLTVGQENGLYALAKRVFGGISV